MTEEQCSHLDTIKFETTTKKHECEECVKSGDDWVHLRLCTQCEHIGCCDDSKNKHATKHHKSTKHPVIKSLEPREDWFWCYPDNIGFVPAPEDA